MICDDDHVNPAVPQYGNVLGVPLFPGSELYAISKGIDGDRKPRYSSSMLLMPRTIVGCLD
jgi:hypothetical protein